MRSHGCALVALAFTVSHSASAQSVSDPGKAVYSQAELANYKATTAEDLVRSIPGAAALYQSTMILTHSHIRSRQ